MVNRIQKNTASTLRIADEWLKERRPKTKKF